MKFNEKLKKAMQELELNQKQVVTLTGCSKGAVSMYLNGKIEPPEQKKRGIAVSLGLAPDYFEYEDATPTDIVRASTGSIRKTSTKELAQILGVDRSTAAKIAKNRELPGLYGVQTTPTNHLYFINEAIFCKI